MWCRSFLTEIVITCFIHYTFYIRLQYICLCESISGYAPDIIIHIPIYLSINNIIFNVNHCVIINLFSYGICYSTKSWWAVHYARLVGSRIASQRSAAGFYKYILCRKNKKMIGGGGNTTVCVYNWERSTSYGGWLVVLAEAFKLTWLDAILMTTMCYGAMICERKVGLAII